MSSGFQTLHLDAMVPPFVDNHSLDFEGIRDLLFPCSTRANYSLHVMSNNPLEYLAANFPEHSGEKTKRIIVPYEIDLGMLLETMKHVRSLGIEFGIAINPGTTVQDISRFLEKDSGVDEILVMTVQPGQYGAKFLGYPLGKIKEIRDAGFQGTIGIDGGANEFTIRLITQSRPSYVVSGSYLQKASDKPAAARVLQDCLEAGR